MVHLNDQQKEASELIKKWFHDPHKKQIFVLSGYAGTGKTFLINYIIENVLNLKSDQVAFATPTGKAASVLIQKGSDATTIHRLIYSPVISEYKTNIKGKEVTTRKISFAKKKSIGTYKLIILDEVSMVNKQIMEDLLYYGIPVLATGDIGQLPAIASDSHNLLEHSDYNLTEIVRQASDNKILTVATMARLNQPIPFGNYGEDVYVLNRALLSNNEFKDILLSADQVICGKNVTRIKLNRLIRQLKGLNINSLPNNNEKLICELNNYEIEFEDKYSLVNGISGYVKNFNIVDEKLKLATISFKPDFLNEYVDNILIEYNIFKNNVYQYEKHQNAYLMRDGSFAIQHKMYKRLPNEDKEEYNKKLRMEFINKKKALTEMMINEFTYGYAISCHKSQGSQWDTVVVIDEGNCFGKDADKWRYTAFTRAAKKLIIIK